MVDLGVNNLFDKVESHFGKWFTRIALLIMILTIMVVCLNTLWTMAVVPFVSSVEAVIKFQSVSSYWDLFKTGTILVLAGALSITLVSNWRFRKEEVRVQQTFEKMTAKIDEALNDPRLTAVLDQIHAEQALKNSAPKTSIVGQVVEDPPHIRPDIA